MAIKATTLASASYITNPNTTSRPFTFGGTNSGVEFEVQDRQIKPTNHQTNPGVFTAGTSVEGSASNPQNDSNS